MKNKPIFSSSLQRELESIRSDLGAASILKLHQDILMFDRLKNFCRRALAETHLVSVASVISREFNANLQDMEAIGIPVDILEQFPDWRYGSRAHFRPISQRLRLASTGAGKQIGSLRLQLSPASPTIPYAFILIRDLLQRMDPSVQFYVVVEPGANLQGLREIVLGFSNSAETRIHLVEGRSVSIFAQDNALATRDELGNPVLMIPRAFRRAKPREEDEISPEEAERNFGIKVVRSQFYWEGGNIIHDGHCCLIGVDTVGKNMVRLGLTRSEVLEGFETEFGSKIVCLGDLSRFRFDVSKDRQIGSGQVSYHIDFNVSLLGRFGRKRRPRALIADPARGIDLLPAVLAHRPLFTKHFLPAGQARDLIEAEYEAFAEEWHPKLLAYCSTLEELGYVVIGVPDLRIDPKENLFKTVNLDFGYCNVLPGLWHGQPAVHYLPWGIRALDFEAEKRFHAAGAHPVRISSNPNVANALMNLYGGLHCFCGQLI